MVRFGRGFPTQVIHRQLTVVAYDNSSGLLYDSTNATSWSWSLAIGTAARCAAVAVAPFWDQGTVTAKVGATSMTQQSHVYANNDTGGTTGGLWLFTLLNPPTGSQTITVTSTSGNTSGAVLAAASYSAVRSVGTPVTKFGTGTALTSNAVAPANPQGGVVQAFMSNASAAITSYNQTSRYANHTGTSQGNTVSIVLGDALLLGSQSFSGTSSSAGWASAAVPLNP